MQSLLIPENDSSYMTSASASASQKNYDLLKFLDKP